MLRCSKQRLLEIVGTASHGTKKIDTDRLMGLLLFEAKLEAMEYFASIHRHFFETQDKRLNAVIESQKTYEALLTRAFTGELTSEWEAANTEQITAKQALHDRLPQLVLLTFLKEKIKRTQHPTAEANVLVTALMKYAFLFQMEGIAKRRLYQFIPYHYGPFAKELYADLETLQEQGLITVDNGDEDKTQIAIANSEATERAIAVPDDFKEDVAAILDAYGDLDHNTLLTTVYEKYPAYAKKSRLQKRRGVDLNDQDS